MGPRFIEVSLKGYFSLIKWNKCITMALIRRIGIRNRSKDETVIDFVGKFVGNLGDVERVCFGGVEGILIPGA